MFSYIQILTKIMSEEEETPQIQGWETPSNDNHQNVNVLQDKLSFQNPYEITIFYLGIVLFSIWIGITAETYSKITKFSLVCLIMFIISIIFSKNSSNPIIQNNFFSLSISALIFITVPYVFLFIRLNY